MVNEEKVDLLLEMLRSADVTDASQDESKTLKELESEEGGRGGGREGGKGELECERERVGREVDG